MTRFKAAQIAYDFARESLLQRALVKELALKYKNNEVEGVVVIEALFEINNAYLQCRNCMDSMEQMDSEKRLEGP